MSGIDVRDELLKRGFGPSTAQAYADESLRFIRLIAENPEIDHALDEMVAQSARRTRLSYNKVRRAVVVLYEALGYQDYARKLEAVPSPARKTSTGQTSNTRLKKAPPHRVTQLRACLEAMPGLGSFCSKLVLATLGTGLRAQEWSSARLENNGNDLVVRNSKFGPERANGPYRRMHIECLDATILEAVNAVITGLAPFDEYDARRRIESCQKLISKANNELKWKRHITLHSCRHQFAANVKQHLDLWAVAALLGHASAQTSTVAYAKRRSGARQLDARLTNDRTGDLFPTPAPDAIQAVRKGPKLHHRPDLVQRLGR